MGRQRAISVVVITANLGGAGYYVLQGRTGLAILLVAVALLLGWLAFRPPSRSTTFKPMRTLTAAAAFFGVLTLVLLISLAGADEDASRLLGGIGAAVAAGFTGVMLWSLVRVRRMGFGWSSELERRQRPDDNPSAGPR